MSHSLFVSDEKKTDLPILIIDRQGLLGILLAKSLYKDLRIVLVGGEKPQEKIVQQHIPFERKVPRIPQEQYSHIFLVFDKEKEFSAILQACSEKTNTDKTKLIVLIPHRYATQDVVTSIIAKDKNICVIILGDLFGEQEVESQLSSAQYILLQTATCGTIKLSHMGLQTLYPVYYKDALGGILQASFGLQKSAKPFIIAPKHPLTELAFVHEIQKIDPEVQIDFIIQKESVKNEDTILGEYLFDTSNQQEHLKNTYQVFRKERKNEYKKPVAFKQPTFLEERTYESERKIFPFRSIIFFLMYLLISFLCLPLLSTLFFLLSGRQALLYAKSSFEKGDMKGLQTYTKQASLSFRIATKTMQALMLETQFFGQIAPVNTLSADVTAGTMFSDALTNITIGVVNIHYVLDGKTQNPHAMFSSGVNALKNAIVTLQKMQTMRELPTELVTKLPQITKALTLFTDTADILPNALGVDGKRTYLILFQNNMELRPAGGFIGSYGLADLQNGKVTALTINDVYDADGQLKGHIEPPYPIRRYLPSVHWYMRDSNFDVDFNKSASAAAFFLSEETGQKVDGVIAVDLYTVKDILSATGGVYVPQYNETVTADNFFLLTEAHAQKNFFPGSSQKKDFLGSFFVALQNKITSGKVAYGSLFEKLLTALNQKDILISFSNPSPQSITTVNGLSSSLWDGRVIKDDTVNDFLGVNEANLGVNKVNYFVSRTISQNIAVADEGTVVQTVHVVYKNTSQTNQWPGGEYKNYLRFILPGGAELTDVTFDGLKQNITTAITDPLIYEKKGFIPPAGLEVEKTQENGKTIYGFLVIIPMGTTKDISISYALAQKFPLDKALVMYDLVLFKQPGVDTIPYTLSFSFPNTFAVFKMPEEATKNGNFVSLKKDITQDTDLQIELVKQ